MRFQTLGRLRCDALSTEHLGVHEDIGEKRFADGNGYAQQSLLPDQDSVLRRRSG
jgi:hypothetical protein